MSGRLQFYHDHAYGITRLNVYAGEAAGYLIRDASEEALITSGIIPNICAGGGATVCEYRWGIPLVIEDKTFVPQNVATQDTLWNTGLWGQYGDFWFPHVYEKNQDPNQPDGFNPTGRWDYGPWVWPPSPAANPVLPALSTVPEAFMDTMTVNGAAYPHMTVDRKAYRFRILNACNDRTVNLQLYYADTNGNFDASGNYTEVKMIVPAPDGRDGGVPDQTKVGPKMFQIGTEAGLLPAVATLNDTTGGKALYIGFDGFGNANNYNLVLQPAERADVIIDFSQVPVGNDASRTLILYNDAPAAFPGGDPRYDYYTGNPDQTPSGGAPTTLAGKGPNTRTIMQFRLSSAAPSAAFDDAALSAALPAYFAAQQPPLIIPPNTHARLIDTGMTVGGTVIPFKGKSINEGFDSTYGRINAVLGTEANAVSTPLAYIDPVTEIVRPGEVQIWKITHNGIDTHPIHFHLLNVQVVNRIGWDGSIIPPDPNEQGWKETVRMNHVQETVVAFKTVAPVLPFAIPDSIRPLDVTMPPSASNPVTNFGHEYVWHCHILGHEEFDLMRPLVFNPNGKTNVLWRNTSTGANVVWYMDGVTNTGGASLTTVPDPNWTIGGVGDFNSDGKPDILWRNATTGANVVWYMNGVTTTGGAQLTPVGDPHWTIGGVGDFNSDGKPDILWRNATTGGNVVWYMNGVTNAGGAALAVQPGANWTIAAVGDFNNDVYTDIVWRDTTTGQNTVWYLNGVTTIGTGSITAIPDANWKIKGAY
jgi:FtsP/CotA-like multicopper oxidase with cupredoxin domain